MNGSAHEFHLEEFKLMKQEISALLGRIETLARLGLVVSAAVFSWLATQGFGPGTIEGTWCTKLPRELFIPAWYLPAAYAVLSGFTAFTTYWRGRQMGEYLLHVERALGATGLGWERTLHPKPPILAATAFVFWALLVIGTLLAGWIGHTVVVSRANAPCAAQEPAPASKPVRALAFASHPADSLGHFPQLVTLHRQPPNPPIEEKKNDS